MKQLLLSLTLLVLTAAAAQADCYADYKAKQDDPLRLHYGVFQVTGACTPEQAEQEIAPKLAADGWQLLNIMGLFDETGLDERRDSAGPFYLRY